jgi:hypothetical protein
MAFIRQKGKFYSMVRNVRRGKKVMQKTVAYLGTATSLEEAIAQTEGELDALRLRLNEQTTATANLKSEPWESRLIRTVPCGVYIRQWKWVKLKHHKQRERDTKHKIKKAKKQLEKLKAVISSPR